MMMTARLGHTNDKLHQTSIHELSLLPHEVYVRRKRIELPMNTDAKIPIHISEEGLVSIIGSRKTIVFFLEEIKII